MRGWFYRAISRMTHKYNWHHAKVCHMEDGSVLYWCQWCGMRDIMHRVGDKNLNEYDPNIILDAFTDRLKPRK